MGRAEEGGLGIGLLPGTWAVARLAGRMQVDHRGTAVSSVDPIRDARSSGLRVLERQPGQGAWSLAAQSAIAFNCQVSPAESDAVKLGTDTGYMNL